MKGMGQASPTPFILAVCGSFSFGVLHLIDNALVIAIWLVSVIPKVHNRDFDTPNSTGVNLSNMAVIDPK